MEVTLYSGQERFVSEDGPSDKAPSLAIIVSLSSYQADHRRLVKRQWDEINTEYRNTRSDQFVLSFGNPPVACTNRIIYHHQKLSFRQRIRSSLLNRTPVTSDEHSLPPRRSGDGSSQLDRNCLLFSVE